MSIAWAGGMATYTAEQVDQLIRTLERHVERQIATAHSAVKGVAAERDLLSNAESARDLLVLAVKGEKEMLDKVFGEGDCERIGRLRHLLDTVKFSDMHAKDQRWVHLRDNVETIEAVLKDLGTFKPWVPPSVKAPERIVYKGLRRRLSPGRRMNMKPEVEGGEAAAFEVEPPLPAALELSPSTGAITGALQPGVFVPEATYVVTARNEAGEAKVELVFSVKETPPYSVAYPAARKELLAGEVVRWEPAVEGGHPTEWSVQPALPEGLTLDPATGAVRGSTLEGIEVTVYEVAAANSGGQATANLQFSVRAAAPRAPVYPCPAEGIVYTLGAPLELIPEVTPGSTLSVTPQLPAGLTLDPATGVISGTPSEPSDMASYEVRARTAGGESRATISFEVKQVPPSALSYPELDERPKLQTGDDVTLVPQAEGAPSEWAVTPDLPAGLSLDPAKGTISGVLTQAVEEGTWTVTAANAVGKTSCELTFSVELAPPKALIFRSLRQEYALLEPLTLKPSFRGEVVRFAVAPELPEGLQLDEATGVISGTPSAVAEEATYEVTAENSAGTTTAALTFSVKRAPPSSLEYPSLEPVLNAGEEVNVAAEVGGSATKFTVEPSLPKGLRLNGATGEIRGVPTAEAAEATYVVTASNEAGKASKEIAFSVALPPPSEISYPMASNSYAAGEPVLIEPLLDGCMGCTFTAEPALPEGLELDPKTGVISGSPVDVSEEEVTYRITAKNASGSAETQLAMQIVETLRSEDVAGSINKDFAAKIEAVTDVAELLAEPSRTKEYGDWMIWMVHRAHLNDPALTDFNFNNMHMPPPHIEARIAPKLVKAMETNTHIETLSLSNTNLMKTQGIELAASLRVNTTLKTLNLEANCLDSQSVRELAEGIRENTGSKLEHFRVTQQKQVGTFFGRPVEEAIGLMMEKNESIIKLGFECNDAHWRNIIDRALLRNNDFARRRRKRTSLMPEEEVVAEEKQLSRLVLRVPPPVALSSVFGEDADPNYPVFLGFVANQKRLPVGSQLQNYAKNSGTSLKYSTVAPLMKDCRSRLLGAAINTEVTVADIFEVDTEGDLRSWSESNGSWSLDIWAPDGKRYAYKSNKEPAFLVSDAWAEWLSAVKLRE